MDRDLVAVARRGDREAYADLIRVRGDRLFAIAQRIFRGLDRTQFNQRWPPDQRAGGGLRPPPSPPAG